MHPTFVHAGSSFAMQQVKHNVALTFHTLADGNEHRRFCNVKYVMLEK